MAQRRLRQFHTVKSSPLRISDRDYGDGTMKPQTPSSYIAPSFSWASLNPIPGRAGLYHPLHMPSKSYMPALSDIVRADRELAFSGNEFGAVLPGRLYRCAARCCRAKSSPPTR